VTGGTPPGRPSIRRPARPGNGASTGTLVFRTGKTRWP